MVQQNCGCVGVLAEVSGLQPPFAVSESSRYAVGALTEVTITSEHLLGTCRASVCSRVLCTAAFSKFCEGVPRMCYIVSGN